MKTCDEMVNSLLERRAQYVSAQKKKKKLLAGAGATLCAVSLLGGGVWYLGQPHHDLPVTAVRNEDVTTTSTTADTTVGTSTTTTLTADTTATAIETTTIAPTQPDGTTATTSTEKIDPPKTTATTGTKGYATGYIPPVPTTTRPTAVQPRPTATQTQPPTIQTQSTQTTPTTQTTVTNPSDDVFVEPLPPWPYWWIVYERGENYGNRGIPICFKLDGFEEVAFDWVKETSYTASGFSIMGDIIVERNVETGGLIYRMVLVYDGVTPKPSFFFSVVTADGMKQTDGLYGYPADHGFFISSSYDSAMDDSYYYLVKAGVLTFDEYEEIMAKYWSQFGYEFSWVETP